MNTKKRNEVVKNPNHLNIYSYSIIAEFFTLCLNRTSNNLFSYQTLSPEPFTGAPAPQRLSSTAKYSAGVLSIHHCLWRFNGIIVAAELLG